MKWFEVLDRFCLEEKSASVGMIASFKSLKGCHVADRADMSKIISEKAMALNEGDLGLLFKVATVIASPQ